MTGPGPGTADAAGPRATLANALSAELLKLRRQRPTWVLATFVLLLLGLAMLAYSQDAVVGADLPSRPLSALNEMLPTTEFLFAAGAGVIMLTSGSRMVGMEYALGTIRVILGRGTGRARLVLAKLLAALILGIGLLLVYSLLAALGLAVVTLHLSGSLAPIQRLPAAGWRELGLGAGSGAVSATAGAAVGVTMAAASRSLTGGMVLSILFFPLDNALALVLRALYALDHLSLWRDLSLCLLGPTLNRLPGQLMGGPMRVSSALPIPMLPLGAAQSLGVVALWVAALVGLALLLSVRRDVLA